MFYGTRVHVFGWSPSDPAETISSADSGRSHCTFRRIGCAVDSVALGYLAELSNRIGRPRTSVVPLTTRLSLTLFVLCASPCHADWVIVDAGHTPAHPGATGASGRVEHLYNLDLSALVARDLQADGDRVTRTGADNREIAFDRSKMLPTVGQSGNARLRRRYTRGLLYGVLL